MYNKSLYYKVLSSTGWLFGFGTAKMPPPLPYPTYFGGSARQT